jgi:dienelactone hydrolase
MVFAAQPRAAASASQLAKSFALLRKDEMGALRRFGCGCVGVAALFGLAARGSPALADTLVKFASAAPQDHVEVRSDPIQGYLTKPKGAGPFPAVVLLHSCLGLPAARRSMADTFAGWGYVALFVDDFTTRGVKETCAVDFNEALPDAYGALTFLSRLPYVDPARIAAIGFSQGADTALKIASSRPPASGSADLAFKAAAAFYPPCDNVTNSRLEIPTLILVGGMDDVTPAADCERLAGRQPGSMVKLIVYPGARHGFDNPEFGAGARLLGMWLAYDREAAQRSRAELRDFLAARVAR